MALALPQEQVAFAAWHLFLDGGCQEGANLGIAQCVCRVSPSARPVYSLEGLAWAGPGGGGQSRARVIIPETPLPCKPSR